ncbi:hypothetical protein F511_28454 [Dorcoceras hygrometricum]|uniref:Uncharacterized protein n=1 Tax=Dorcoceras hygrometricum TaxID=472368 RepID=A0A2Z7DEJ2_9LAMI|nr:hypothetical protein F511_28454 [Dorcoceras hygrometricum]
MFKGRKCSDFRIYGKDNRRSKLEGRAAVREGRLTPSYGLTSFLGAGESAPEQMGGGV